MFHCRTLLLLAGLFVLTALRPAAAQTPSASEKAINLSVENADIHVVMKMLERETGATIIVQNGNTPYRPLTLDLLNVSLDSALQQLAKNAGADVERTARSLYTIHALTAAGTPSLPLPAPSHVQLQVALVTASVADVDNLGINFDLLAAHPYPAKPDTQANPSTAGSPAFLQFATGSLVAQLLQSVKRNHKIVQSSVITTPNNVTATIETTPLLSPLNRQANILAFQNRPTVTPHANTDGSLTLQITLPAPGIVNQNAGGASSAAPPPVTITKTIKSGGTLLFAEWIRKSETTNHRNPIFEAAPVLGGPFHSQNTPGDQEALFFITPTIINSNNTTNAGGQPEMVTP